MKDDTGFENDLWDDSDGLVGKKAGKRILWLGCDSSCASVSVLFAFLNLLREMFMSDSRCKHTVFVRAIGGASVR